MPEGDTIHRAARRLQVALAGRQLDQVEAPNPRSPMHRRSSELEGAIVEHAEARGKHLLLHFDNELTLHSQLGINGRWRISSDGRLPYGKPWLLLASGRSIASVSGGKILRLVRTSRARNDPVLLQLGPDPLAAGFDEAAAVQRLKGWEPGEPVGAALLDQSLLAGIGNVIRIEALWLAQISPWRKVGALSDEEAAALVRNSRWVMETSRRKGSRPTQIYGNHARQPCRRCGGRILTHGQGDDNRVTYWCEGCQL